jgi:predicted MPP superfamily phosphohydrolase
VLPYLKVQFAYVLASAALVALVDWACARSARLRESRRLRFVVTALGVAAPLFVWLFVIKAVDHTRSQYQFVSVALGFYAAAIWMPLLWLARMWRERARRPIDRVLAAACALAILAGQYSLWIEPNRLVTSTYTIDFAQWPRDEPPLRVVHISDLQTVGACAREREAAALINAMQPELIVITGDYVSGPFFDAEPAIAAARAFLQALGRPKYGIVCVAGHSEPERIRERVFEGLDVRYLCNQMLELELDGGRRLRLFGARALGCDLTTLTRRDEPGLVTLVASHEPDLSWELEGRGVDLHLAGHTHGGQIALPFIGPPMMLSALPRRFARGLHAFGDHLIHVNAGVGMEGNHAPRIRFLCPPEVDLLLLGGGGSVRAAEPPPSRS